MENLRATFPAVSEVLTDTNTNAGKEKDKKMLTAADIQSWLVSYLAELLEINTDEVETTIPFDRYGLDSSALVGITGDLEDFLKIGVDPTLLYDYPTVKSLSEHLAKELQVKV
jgi:acyl carrier protein